MSRNHLLLSSFKQKATKKKKMFLRQLQFLQSCFSFKSVLGSYMWWLKPRISAIRRLKGNCLKFETSVS